jgi:hypothetical protein
MLCGDEESQFSQPCESIVFVCLTVELCRGEARVRELKMLHETEAELAKSHSQAELSLARAEGSKRAEALVHALEAAAAAVTR